MKPESIRARLNLFAVLKNLEALAAFDEQTRERIRDWRLSIQFDVFFGPKAFVQFDGGVCRVGKGKIKKPDIRLFFICPGQLNKMFDGKGFPLLLKGFSRLGFLTKDFPKLTDRLAYYLKPAADRLEDPAYLALNTRLTLMTAAHASAVLSEDDPVGKLAASGIRDGNIRLEILPDGPGVTLRSRGGVLRTDTDASGPPLAVMEMKDVGAANRFLNGETDAFTAVTSGEVAIRGQIPMLDQLGLILDRIPIYLS